MDLFSMVDPIGWTHSIVLQAAAIEVKPSAEVELLKSQLEFLKADHARLAADFAERMKQLTTQSASVGDDFKTYLNYVSGLILFATGIFGFIGWNSLEQAKSSIKTMVDRQLSGTVAETVDREIQMVRRSILREQVVSNTTIDYFLKDGVEPAEELRLLRSRGFSKIRFCREVGKLRRDTADVVVVDLEHWLPDGNGRLADLTDKEERTKMMMSELFLAVPNETIFVVYVNGFIKYLNDLPKNRVVMSNSQISLIGNMVDAAYVAANHTKA